MMIFVVLLLVIICQLACLLRRIKKPDAEEKKPVDYQKIIPAYIGKRCELILKKPLYELDAGFSITGTIVDCDGDWVMVEETGKKTPVRKLLRISNIRSIKEITA